MTFVNDDALERMIDAHERATSRAARRIADAGTDHLLAGTQRRTPIDTNPYRSRPERPRGTAKRSIHRLEGVRVEVRAGGKSYVGDVLSFDVIVRFLEFGTPPHKIRPKDPGGRLRFQSRHGWVGEDGTYFPPGTWVSVEEVDHPGTKGLHMFSLAALATEAELDEYARGPLAQWKREVESYRQR